MIPSPPQCFQLIASHKMLDNIKAHSLVVARIAEFITMELNDKGMQIPLDLVVAAALLHDIGKTQCLNTNKDHARLGAEICLQHDLHEIAPIVAQHVILERSFPDTELSAREVVYYADKRVNHDQIVSLQDRLAYIIDRYSQNNPRRQQAINHNFIRCCTIEEGLFASLDFEPDSLAERLNGFASPSLSEVGLPAEYTGFQNIPQQWSGK